MCVWEEPVVEPKSQAKSFVISKKVVLEAWEDVRSNQGAAGVDEESIEDFERDLSGNLYRVWNRLSSGSYMPPAVRAVRIPKPHGLGVRVLGVPTVADRVAQTVVRRYLEPGVEPFFHPDSYGYRPGRSALGAVRVCRDRCWKYDWVIDLDFQSFFDSLDHRLVLKAVAAHTNKRWILLYVERWLKAPAQQEDGTVVARDRGTAQGSVVSPVLANIFLHYALDLWMARESPAVPFERYADDVVVHCKSERQARFVLGRIKKRMRSLGVQLNLDKTRIVYCRDSKRVRSHEQHERFDFLGYTFRPRPSRERKGAVFVNFSPAISDEAAKKIRQTIRRWRLHIRSETTLTAIARKINPIVHGWINYYGKFYPSWLARSLRSIDKYLVRWAMRKYKRLHRRSKRARELLESVATREPTLFAHWRILHARDRMVGAV
jgi:group II intron reverse transcriptase/maturase